MKPYNLTEEPSKFEICKTEKQTRINKKLKKRYLKKQVRKKTKNEITNILNSL